MGFLFIPRFFPRLAFRFPPENIFPEAEDAAMPRGKAFSLLSGGLDSLLASRLVMAQSVAVTGVHFITPFFGYDQKGHEEEAARHYERKFGIPARILDVSEGFFRTLRNPRYGYGKNFNPCIDCKIFLFSRAKALLEEENADFLITGEVLGQRPMSQRRDTLRIVERDSRTDGILLRPLSARHLKPALPEIAGLVDREKLLGLTGRSRKPQMALAREFGLQDYPTPGGGCLLTDPGMAARIRRFFSEEEEVTAEDVVLLTLGRQFRLPGGVRLVLGRREEENIQLNRCYRPGDLLLKVKGIPGPLGLIRGNPDEADLRTAGAILARYSKARSWPDVEIEVEGSLGNSGAIRVKAAGEDEISAFRYS
jgi:tRNA-uridine 2-sulfurtransferase